jgi:hypothetical protein
VIRLAIAACAEQQEAIAEPFEAIVDLIGVVLLFFLPVRTFDYPSAMWRMLTPPWTCGG